MAEFSSESGNQRHWIAVQRTNRKKRKINEEFYIQQIHSLKKK